jgi:predicted nucleic acid-binding protein
MLDVAVDTNVFIASLLEQDQFHADAISFMERIGTKQCRAHLSCIVLVELAGALSRRVTEKAAREAIEIMNGWIAEGKIKLYELTKKRMASAAELAMNLKLRGMDAITCQIADEFTIPFKSYDEEVRKKIGRVIELL